MKKTYVKPQVYFEDFQLSANIAGNCAIKTMHAETECKWFKNVEGVGKVFISKELGCEYFGNDGDYSVCYHVPVDATKLFTS